MAITEKQASPFSHSLQEAKDIVNIPSGIIEVLRYIATTHMNVLEEQELFDKFADRDIRAALAIMAESPSGVETGPETVLSLVRNPDSAENQKFLSKNPAFFQAFPILKQIYKHNIPSSNVQTREDIDDFGDMFGKDHIPEDLKAENILKDIEKRQKELDPQIKKEEKWFKEFKAMGKEPSTDKKTGKKKPTFKPTYLTSFDKESEAPDLSPDAYIERVPPAGTPMLADRKAQRYIEMEKLRRQKEYPEEPESDVSLLPRIKRDPDKKVEEEEVGADELPETDSESGRDAYTIEKDVAITEALEAGDYKKVERIEEAYKNKKPIPTEWTDDWSYMGAARNRHQEGGLVGYANGGELPVGEDEQQLMDAQMGFVGTQPEAAIDQAEAAKNGEMGGDKVDKNVPEGSYVLNSYAVELAGIKDIEKLIKDAQRFYSDIQETEGIVQQPIEGDVEVRVSEGEYIIPPALVKIIGRDRLEKINNRGIEEFNRQQTAETEEGGMLEGPQESEGFMSPEGGAPMSPEGGAPMLPEQVPQGFALGGVAQEEPKVGVYQFLNALGPILGKGAKPATAPKRVAQATKPKVGGPARPQTGGPRIGGQPGQPPSPLARVNPLSPGAQNLQKPNVRVGNMGGFIPYSRYG